MTPRLTLAIEASNPAATRDGGASGGMGVALGLVRPGEAGATELLGAEPIRDTGRHDDDLMPAIARLFERLVRRAEELELVAVSTGPGGYTGLRIAVSAGKMIAETARARCVAGPTSLAIARRCAHEPGTFGVALNSKNDTAFVSWFEPDGAMRGELMTAPDLAKLDIRVLIADSFLPDPFVHACGQRGIAIERPTFDAAAVLECAAILPGVDPAELLPIYGREPDAVTQWRKRGKG